MAQKYLSIPEKIKMAHAFKNCIPTMDFDWSINPYLGVWYAEERLYVLLDCMVDAIYLVEADSPKDAIYKVLKRHEEAEHAGEYVPEEVK